MDSSTQLVAILVILVVFVANALQVSLRRRGAPPLRRIQAYEMLRPNSARSAEAAEPVHVSLGSATIGGQDTLLALAGSYFAFYAAHQLARGAVAPLFTVTDTAAVPLMMDTLRRAYHSRGLLADYRPVNVRWYPAGPRSLAFAGGVTAMQSEDRIGANYLVGSFGPELALIGEAADRRGRPFLAVSDQLDGQAVAYALSDHPLIGEELFAAPGYLSNDANLIARNIVIDVARWLLILALVAILIYTLLGRG